jgi:hypothetical protein
MSGITQSGVLHLVFNIALSLFIFLAIGCLCGLLAIFIRRRFIKKVQQEIPINLNNLGNVPSVFHLTAESLEPLLQFKFLQNGLPIPEVIETVEIPQISTLDQGSIKSLNSTDTTVVPTKNKSVPAQASKQPPAAVKTANKAADKTIAKAGALSGLLGVVGGLLPGSLGKSIKEKGLAVRDVQTKTKEATEKPAEMQRKLDEVQKNSNKLGVSTQGKQAQSSNNSISTDNSNQPGANSQVSKTEQKISVPTRTQTLKYFCTNEIYPGESLKLTLYIGTKKYRVPKGSFFYKVHSQQVPTGNFDNVITVVTKQGFVSFSPISKWYIFYTALLSALLVAASSLAIIYFVILLWV